MRFSFREMATVASARLVCGPAVGNRDQERGAAQARQIPLAIACGFQDASRHLNLNGRRL
jgi:hypothetical protein